MLRSKVIVVRERLPFIKEEKHLPNIPPAKQIAKEGIAVSEILTKQMKKIEELTLYLIALQKENSGLKSENRKLKNGQELLIDSHKNLLSRVSKLELAANSE